MMASGIRSAIQSRIAQRRSEWISLIFHIPRVDTRPIPDSAKEKPQQGEVISVGKGKSNDEGKVFPLDVKAGDTILFGKYSGTEIKLDGEEFLIMREEEVLGIVKK